MSVEKEIGMSKYQPANVVRGLFDGAYVFFDDILSFYTTE